MRLKLDENLGTRIADILRNAGHDTATIPEQSLCSSSDRELLQVCRVERRCLVTPDLGFANPIIFKPSGYSGIVVLRLPRKPSSDDLLAAVQTVVAGFTLSGVDGKLWIAQRGRIREYQEEDALDDV